MMKFFSLLALMAASTAIACPSGTQLLVENNERFCLLKGKYLNSNMTLTSNFVYRLDDEGVFFGGDNKQNSVLRIQAGTKIVGEPGSFLVIHRGSKIFAEGTKSRPVVFTSFKTLNRKRGDWGGIVINGNAPINACKPGTQLCEAISEGIKVEAVKFGGNDAFDNSRVLRFVRVEFPGYPISQDNELNGITFNGVGAGTEVDYVQVNMSADDGVEFFGGTVNVKHLVLTGSDDDSLDWDMGYTGKIQYLAVKQADDSADNGVEADNFKSPMNAEPRSNPTISNATFLGGKNSAYGLLLRRGTAASFYNTILTGFNKTCIDIDDAETFSYGATISGDLVRTNGLKMEASIVSCNKNTELEDGDLWSTEKWLLAQGNKIADPKLSGFFPIQESPVHGNGITPEDLFFDPVDYVGAFASAEDDWMSGWTSFAQD